MNNLKTYCQQMCKPRVLAQRCGDSPLPEESLFEVQKQLSAISQLILTIVYV